MRGLSLSCCARLTMNVCGQRLAWACAWQKWYPKTLVLSREQRPASEEGHRTSVHRAVFPAPGAPVMRMPRARAPSSPSTQCCSL
ncbi:hypothetical protein FKM82_029981 [Ascaphus truei]